MIAVLSAIGGLAFQPICGSHYRKLAATVRDEMQMGLNVMVNGMPGPMALEVARACIDRGFNLVPVGFTGPNQPNSITVDGAKSNVNVELKAGPGIGNDASAAMKDLKAMYPDLVVVDYTHPSAILNNLACYVDHGCEFVMGTTGGDPSSMMDIFDKGTNLAVIAPNMGKQIVALQAALQEMAKRFPGSFEGYKLAVTESHQSSKADTSGTAKAVVSHLVTLSADSFKEDDIVKLRQRDAQLAFKVPEDHLGGHAFHTYRLTSPDNSVSFELQHNVCGRRVYAEGTADAVAFIHKMKKSGSSKRLYNMIDVLESGQMN